MQVFRPSAAANARVVSGYRLCIGLAKKFVQFFPYDVMEKPK